MFTDYNSNNIDRRDIITEQSNPISKEIDNLNTKELVDIFVEEDKKPQQAVAKASNEIAICIDRISDRLRNNGRLFYIGAGTSGRLAVLDAAECPPTFCTKPDLIQAVLAGGINAMTNSSENIEDDRTLSVTELKSRHFSSKDCLIGITAGGTTPFVLSALDYSMQISALSIAITCVPDCQVKLNSDVIIRLVTGPEIISGSTRLKAATATKMTLNIISTGVMIKLGKVYSNKMIDLSIKNSKLLDRALRIMNDILKVEKEEALELLDQSNGSVKLSCLIKLTGVSFDQANELLIRNDGSLRKALKSVNQDIFKKRL